MINSLQKKYFHPLMAALLVFAVIGSLIFFRVEMPNKSEMVGRKPYSKSAFAPFDNTVYWLAEETGILSKVKKNSSSTMWNGAPRVQMPVEALSVAGSLIIFLTNHIYFQNISYAIPLKLRKPKREFLSNWLKR
jgi:hypothetical protein